MAKREQHVSVVLGSADHRLTRAEWRALQDRVNEQLGDTEECPVHSYQSHGREAEELRKGIEGALGMDLDEVDDYLRDLLDNVDARDSLAFGERRQLLSERWEVRNVKSQVVIDVCGDREAARGRCSSMARAHLKCRYVVVHVTRYRRLR